MIIMMILGFIFVMFMTISIASIFLSLYFVLWVISKIFRSAKMEAKANNMRKRSSLKYWTDKQKAQEEARKAVKKNDFRTIAQDRFEEKFGYRKPRNGPNAWNETQYYAKMKREVKAEMKAEKKKNK